MCLNYLSNNNFLFMPEEEAFTRIEKLKDWLNDWNYKYFVLNKTDIDEGARDQLKKELIALEEKYPQFITSDSPTQRVGSALSGRFKKVCRSASSRRHFSIFP